MAPYSDSLPPRLLGTAPAVGVAGGTPGKFAPWNARRPANLAALQAVGALGQVAAWTPGQYVQLRDGSSAHWTGTAWAAGAAPAPVQAARRTATTADEGPVLEVEAGTPGRYRPELKAGERPRNVTELRERAIPLAGGDPWERGQYVLVGENGKRAHYDGDDWKSGESPGYDSAEADGTVPDGTVLEGDA